MTIAYDDMLAKLKFGLPDRLGKALVVSGVSSNEMAKHLGESRTTISNYINGRTPVKRQTLVSWAVRTGVPIEWLETGREDTDRPTGGGTLLMMPESGPYVARTRDIHGGIALVESIAPVTPIRRAA